MTVISLLLSILSLLLSPLPHRFVIYRGISKLCSFYHLFPCFIYRRKFTQTQPKSSWVVWQMDSMPLSLHTGLQVLTSSLFHWCGRVYSRAAIVCPSGGGGGGGLGGETLLKHPSVQYWHKYTKRICSIQPKLCLNCSGIWHYFPCKPPPFVPKIYPGLPLDPSLYRIKS